MTALTLATRWNPIDWPLTHGPIPKAVYVAGWAALILLALRRDRSWWRVGLPGALFTAAGLSLMLEVVVDGWWHPFPEGTPRYVTWWIATALLGLCLAGYRMRRSSWRRRGLSLGLGLTVLLMAASEVNTGFGQYPTGRVILAPWLTNTDQPLTPRVEQTLAAPEGAVLDEVWKPQGEVPAKGTVSVVPIPGTWSGFRARDAFVYLPPAYQATPRPLLPVVVMISGQPGIPGDWVLNAQLNEVLDAFAAKHNGLAPIVVMPDQLGSTWNNTLCLDSRIAKVQTYLAVDVPNWIRQNLQAAEGRKSWAIGGASMGGTCALQLGLNAPDVYGTVLDMAGQEEPTLGTRAETVQKAFGGDEKRFEKVDPLHLMARRKFPDTSVAFVVGESDSEFRPQMQKVYQAALAADMKATFALMPGGHGWVIFRPGIVLQLPWLTQQIGLTR